MSKLIAHPRWSFAFKVLWSLSVIILLAGAVRIVRVLTYNRFDRDSSYYLDTAANWFDRNRVYPADWRLAVNDISELTPIGIGHQSPNGLISSPVLSEDVLMWTHPAIVFPSPTQSYRFSAWSMKTTNVPLPQQAAEFRIFYTDNTSSRVILDFQPLPGTGWHYRECQLKITRPVRSLWIYLLSSGGLATVGWDDIKIEDAAGHQLLSNGTIEKTTRRIFANMNDCNPTFYPFLLAVSQCCGLSAILFGIGLGIVLSMGMVYAVYDIGKNMFRLPLLALLGALLVAVHPYLVRISVDIMRESVYIPALVISLMYVMRWLRYSGHQAMLPAGLWAGVAILTRSEGLEVLLAPIAAAMIMIFTRTNGSPQNKLLKEIFCGLLQFTLGVVIITLPLLWYFHSLGNTWLPVDLTRIQEMRSQLVRYF